MIQALLVVIVLQFFIGGGLLITLSARSMRLRKAEEEVVAWKNAFTEAEQNAARLKKWIAAKRQAEEKANVQRTELSQTANADLVKRANSLFGVLRE